MNKAVYKIGRMKDGLFLKTGGSFGKKGHLWQNKPSKTQLKDWGIEPSTLFIVTYLLKEISKEQYK